MANVIDLSGNTVKADAFEGSVSGNDDIAALTEVGAGGLDVSLDTSDTYSDAAVAAAVNASLDLVQAKLDAIIAALQA